MKVKEIATLPDQLYSNNKVKLKKIMKAHGLKFNTGALHTASVFLWQGAECQVEGKFTKDGEGVTVHSELVVTGEERTQLFDDLKELIEELGGSWEVVDVKQLIKESNEALIKEIHDYEAKEMAKLTNEELNARRKGAEHCPVIKPMIVAYLTERHENYGLKDLTPHDVLAEVYAEADAEVK